MTTIQTAPIFRLLTDWQKHKHTFEEYKLHGIQPDIYGRDAPLSHPEMNHIHLASTDELAKKWSKISRVYYRTAPRNKPESDFWLLYAHDEMTDTYLLLTIIGPESHNAPRWRSFLNGLAIEIIEPWISGRLDDVY